MCSTSISNDAVPMFRSGNGQVEQDVAVAASQHSASLFARQGGRKTFHIKINVVFKTFLQKLVANIGKCSKRM